MRVEVVKGRAAVDPSCPEADACHVYEERDDVYDALLNQAIESETRLHASGQSAGGVDYRFFINRGDCFQARARARK